MNQALRGLPAVHRFLGEPAIAAFEPLVGRECVKRAIAAELDRARLRTTLGFAALRAAVLKRLEAELAATLLGVINATGILLHTNLGRAPLAGEALEEAMRIGTGYSNLEYDLAGGGRGSRYDRVSGVLRELTGAQAALVVNNCAAAVLLILDTFARGREVIVSRNQLIEIGGGFRLPDVLRRSGASLVEVGATNKVYLADFEAALSPRTALLLRTHPSNFSIEGFTHDVPGAQLSELGKRVGVPVVEDLGSGALVDLRPYGLPHERTVAEAVAEGIGLVAFSGDKLLGGPQAGIIVGSQPLVARLKSNPLLRALRVDKLTLAALAATLRLYATPESLRRIPFYAMASLSCEELRLRGARYAARLPAASVVDCAAYVGGGSLAQASFPSVAVALATGQPDALDVALRAGHPPIVARIEHGRVLLDLRTVAECDDEHVIGALVAASV
ncbi:MAG: L-seryl-tRNA(Sec) selenium transferase [Vulcanimicrobiaceae bacterium]